MNNQKIIFILLIIISVLTNLSCSNCVKSTGELMRQTRTLNSFQRLEVWDNVRVILTNDLPPDVVQIQAGKHLINQISTEIQNQTLIIRNDNSCHWLRSFEVKVEVWLNPISLNKITYQSNGILRTEGNLTLKNLTIDISSPADIDFSAQIDTLYLTYSNASRIKLQGKAQYLSIESDGLGLVEAENLLAAEVFVIHKNINEIRVNASKLLDVIITDRGTVAYYFQEPQQKVAQISPRGNLVKRL